MSLFGEVDDGDRRRRQHENLRGLTELVKVGAKHKLPPLTWRLDSSYGTLSGTVDTNGTDQHPRATFEAWHAALSKVGRIEPGRLGFRGDGAPRDERTNSAGETRIIAVFKMRLTERDWPTCEFVIQASW